MENQTKIQNSVDYIEKTYVKKSPLINWHAVHIYRNFIFTGFSDRKSVKRSCEAAKEIDNTCETITDIAYKYQFGSEETFSRAFKRMYGISPKELQ